MLDVLFRFEVFCTNKQLGDAIALLTGRVTQITPPQVVTNAKATRNGIKAISANGTLPDRFAAHLVANKPAEINAKYAADFLSSQGSPRSNAGYLLKKAIAAKLIKRKPGTKGTSMRYLLMPSKRADGAVT